LEDCLTITRDVREIETQIGCFRHSVKCFQSTEV
jgi:hypothetical protein